MNKRFNSPLWHEHMTKLTAIGISNCDNIKADEKSEQEC